jgi:hypothetical protein
VDVIYILLSLIFDITLLGGGLLFFIKLFHFRRNLVLKNNIQVQEAKVIMLRIVLKSRVRKKVATFKTQFTKPIHPGEQLDEALKMILNNNFEKSDDFQSYFDVCRRINGFISSEQEKTVEELLRSYGDKRFENFMGPDINNELAIIRVIKEMTEATSKHFTYIEYFNRLNPKIKFMNIDPLLFIALYDVKRIYRDSVEKLGDRPIEIEIESQIENAA